MTARKTGTRASKTKRKRKNTFARLKPRIDLRVAEGSITEADARAVVLGFYDSVKRLSGAAHALDQRTNGAVTDILDRNMFLGKVGEIFVLPTMRHDVRADMVVLAGMGRFDKFDPVVLEVVAENVARTLVRARVDEFAMVLFGATRATAEKKSKAAKVRALDLPLTRLIEGFIRGVRGSRERNVLRAITVCDYSTEVCDVIEGALTRLYKKRGEPKSPGVLRDIDVSLERFKLPERKEVSQGQRPVILQATQEPAGKGKTRVRLSILATGARATAMSRVTRPIRDESLKALVEYVDIADDDEETGFIYNNLANGKKARHFEGALREYGQRIARTLVPADIRDVLGKVAKGRHIVLMHDTGMSRVPWETLCIKSWFPAGTGGMSRQYIADHVTPARWLDARRYDEGLQDLDLLLIVDPTDNLEDARAEGEKVENAARSLAGVNVTALYGRKATKTLVKKELESGRYDVLHYAGHSAFEPDNPEDCGIVLAREQYLTGNELRKMKNLPALVFFNSCQSGRMGGLEQPAGGARRNIGLAEAFLQGGVANYVGTHWWVSDDAAPYFMKAFYGALIEGESIGIAVSKGRQAVRKEAKSMDWADYIHYGNPDFVLKFSGTGTAGR